MTLKALPKIGQIIHDLSREDYDRLSQLINFSNLKHMKKSPLHVRHAMTTPFEDTDAKKVGRVTHVAVFEPDQFRARTCVWDCGPRKGKEWDAFKARNAGLEILTENEYERVVAIQAAVRADANAVNWLSGGRGEVTITWNHVAPKVGDLEGYTLACRGRLDFLKDGAIVDLKVTRDASPGSSGGFARSAVDYSINTQAAWYVDGVAAITGKCLPYMVVAVENEPPYPVAVYEVRERLLQLGRDEYRGWLDRYELCRKTSTWPGYAAVGEVLELELPRWADPEGYDGASGLGLVIGE